ncbi:hypothetical protein ACTEZJ_001520 [Vibrio fluvialis]
MMNTYQKLTEARNLIDEVLSRHKWLSDRKHLPAEALAQKQKLFKGVVDSQEAFDVVHAINTLAMANTDVIHVFTRFAGHVREFSVYAHSANAVYQEGIRTPRLIDENVYMDKGNALEKLLIIESQLTELIIEAREQAEAEVNA